MDKQTDIDFMRHALDLAERGRGKVSPNPLVGAVVVHNGIIVGRGWHQRAGTEHAEIHALREAGEKARNATLYVTLEPCCHHGKTPPCTDAIKKAGIARVVAAITDPNPLVCGEGTQCLHDDGIDMTVGVLSEEARKQNEVFLKYIQTQKPFVTLKLASTLDGFCAATDNTSKWITGSEARKQVHLMRSWSDAVMVGAGTVRTDNPSLTVRDSEGNDPYRIIVDPDLTTPLDAKVLKSGTAFLVRESMMQHERIEQFQQKGADIIPIPETGTGMDLVYAMRHIGSLEITSILCEGGPTLATSLIREHLVDKVVFMFAPKLLGDGLKSLNDFGINSIANALEINDISYNQFGNDMMVTGYPNYPKGTS